MKLIQLGRCSLPVKDYHCAGEDGVYLPKDDGKIWFYVNLTNICNARCSFCVNSAVGRGQMIIDPGRFREVLTEIAPHVAGVSITGGEPMLFPELVDKTAEIVTEVLGSEIRLELVTNGTDPEGVLQLRMLNRFTCIHISRHQTDDEGNRKLMGFSAPDMSRIRNLTQSLSDPGKIVFNCVLQRGGVQTLEEAAAFLEMAAEAGVQNTSFVGLFLANDYCRDHYVSPAELDFQKNERFCLWRQQWDHDYCRCGNGDYRSENGYVRFYFRCPGTGKAPYARQLVYNHDNRLLDGFGGEEILL